MVKKTLKNTRECLFLIINWYWRFKTLILVSKRVNNIRRIDLIIKIKSRMLSAFNIQIVYYQVLSNKLRAPFNYFLIFIRCVSHLCVSIAHRGISKEYRLYQKVLKAIPIVLTSRWINLVQFFSFFRRMSSHIKRSSKTEFFTVNMNAIVFTSGMMSWIYDLFTITLLCV